MSNDKAKAPGTLAEKNAELARRAKIENGANAKVKAIVKKVTGK